MRFDGDLVIFSNEFDEVCWGKLVTEREKLVIELKYMEG